MSTLKNLKARADHWFAKFIRERDKNKPCVTCDKMASKKDCGHFISRRYEATRYNEKNSHGQCIKCNRFEYGNQFKHGQAIDRMYGEGTAEGLELRSHWVTKRNAFDYKMIIQEFKQKYNDLTSSSKRS